MEHKIVYIALDLEEPVKYSVIGAYESVELAEEGIKQYQSWKIYPSESIRLQEHDFIKNS